MVKRVSPFLFLCLVLLEGIGAQTNVTVTMDVPDEVDAGKAFIVSIKISKGSLEEFSRFQQELPVGLTAEQISSGTADYSFEKQRIRYIWLKLPPDEEIDLSYKVNVEERLKGDFSMDGVFSYVESNERKMVEVPSGTVTIVPSPDVPVARQVDVSKYADVLAAEQEARSAQYDITCIRQTPYLMSTGEDIMVNLLVYKKNLDKFAKIEEQVPDGFEARSVESRDAIFSFQEGVARFVWMNLPNTDGFSISYRLVPVRQVSLAGLTIEGEMSYILNGQNMTVPVRQEDVDLRRVDEQDVTTLMAAIESGNAEKGNAAPLTGTIGPDAGAAPQAEKETTATNEPVQQETPPEKDKTVQSEPNTTARTAHSGIPASLQLAVMDGIYYRVQIGAFRKMSDPDEAFSGSALGKPIKIEFHEGFYKYTIGPFSSYDEASIYKDNLLNSGKLRDAFVTAYRNGIRRSVDQAMSAGSGE